MYAFLGPNLTLTVIISSGLLDQVEQLLQVLKEFKVAIGWTIANIKGISSAFCKHKILLEDGHKPSRKHQRRMNPNMEEVVKKEVIKWLDVVIIFPISDSNCISPIQCMPKKGGITIAQNENNELISTRTITGWRIFYGQMNEPPGALASDGRQVVDIIPPGPELLVSEGESRWRFITNFSKIANPLCKFLEKYHLFVFSDDSGVAFEELKKRLVYSPIIVAPDWEQPFELMCDASDYVVGAVLGQRNEKVMHPIYYASRTLSGAQLNYTVTEKEMLALVFTFNKFSSQGKENQVADHFSRLERAEKKVEVEEIVETFPDEQLLATCLEVAPWYADIDEPYLFRICVDNMIQRCIPEIDQSSILQACHAFPYGSHFGRVRIAAKVLGSGFHWPTLINDAHFWVKCCDKCNRTGNISRRHEMLMNPIQEVKVFYVWGIDFMGTFVSSYGIKYILVAVDYVSKWVEAVALPSDDANGGIGFLRKNIFLRFGTPRAIISDGGTHFCNRALAKLLEKYVVRHKVASNKL
ncbi:PREDICTED: uncharacterized protein LOC109239853 [Nicotiana attenuata]|uniref:uncharacterized protein LOC109239853 n=1 Tax=Nicotiana attenuata TaxID=49451 RepID=UPI000904A503|nr:PREDICTED: uncharacterized protein LOC109239853 [Nicotiana attenuata]